MPQKSTNSFFLVALLLFASTCKHRGPADSNSQVSALFEDQQRFDGVPEQYPYVLSIAGTCTGFVIDKTHRIAVTASHCDVSIGTKICLRAPDGRWAKPTEAATSACKSDHIVAVTKIIETSASYLLDYVIFEFSVPEVAVELGELKFPKENYLGWAYKNKMPLELIGYPGDKYRKSALTVSQCQVQSPEIKVEDRSSFKHLLAAWESDKAYYEHPEYQRMRHECLHIAATSKYSRPSFSTDCSVYGGNSGGPLKITGYDIVIAMPSTYYRDPNHPMSSKSCYEAYWDTFFRPIYKTDAPVSSPVEHWDSLQRNSADKSQFPRSIPAHLILEASAFLKANPQYTK